MSTELASMEFNLRECLSDNEHLRAQVKRLQQQLKETRQQLREVKRAEMKDTMFLPTAKRIDWYIAQFAEPKRVGALVSKVLKRLDKRYRRATRMSDVFDDAVLRKIMRIFLKTESDDIAITPSQCLGFCEVLAPHLKPGPRKCMQKFIDEVRDECDYDSNSSSDSESD